MAIQMKPTSYFDPNGYFFSASQCDQFDRCKKSWWYDKFSSVKPNNIEFFPFEYGNYVHDMLEACLEEKRDDWRINKMYDYMTTHPRSTKVNEYLGKNSINYFIENGLVPRFKNLENVTQSCEISLGVKAPDNWFDEGYLDTFRQYYPNVEFIGFRGKIDYYGKDLKDGLIKIIDWKTGKPRKYKMKSYGEQVSQYAYLFNAHGYDFDAVSLYFVDEKEEISIDPDIDIGETLIKDKLTRIIKYIQYQKDYPKNRSTDCNICRYGLKCHKEDNVVLQMWG